MSNERQRATALLEALPGTRLNKKVVKNLRVLTLDIERLPGTAYLWGPKTRYVPAKEFVEWPQTLTVAARWYGTKKPLFYAAWEEGGWEQMIRAAWSLYEEADVVIGYNSIGFDNKHLATDWLSLGLGKPSPWKDVDLLRVVRREFGFEQASLDTVTRRLGRGGKQLHYDREMAQAAAAGDEKAQRTLRRYNVGDVELTEWLADRLRGFMPGHPLAPGTDSSQPTCNQCYGTNLVKQDQPYRAIVMDYTLLQCADCKAWVRGTWEPVRITTTRGV